LRSSGSISIDPDAKQKPGAVSRPGTLREFQFPEYIVPVIRASACQTETRHASRGAATRAARPAMSAVRGEPELLEMSISGSDPNPDPECASQHL
jgi:hypothetical protein